MSQAPPPFTERLGFALRVLLLPASLRWGRGSEANAPAPSAETEAIKAPEQALECANSAFSTRHVAPAVEACAQILRQINQAQKRKAIFPLTAGILETLRMGARVAPEALSKKLADAFLFGPIELLQQQVTLCASRNEISQGALACEALALCATLPNQDLLLGTAGVHQALAEWHRQGPLGIQVMRALCASPITLQQAREIDAASFADLIDMLRHLPFTLTRIKQGEDGFWLPEDAHLLGPLCECLSDLPLPWSQNHSRELAMALARQKDWMAFPKLLGQSTQASALLWLEASMLPMGYDEHVKREQARFLDMLRTKDEARVMQKATGQQSLTRSGAKSI